MLDLQENANQCYPLFGVPTSISKSDEYNGNEIQYIKRAAFMQGAEFVQKEYEDKLRWIPVEEKLPEKKFGNYSDPILVKTNIDTIHTAYYDFRQGHECFYSSTEGRQIYGVVVWRSIL